MLRKVGRRIKVGFGRNKENRRQNGINEERRKTKVIREDKHDKP